MVEPNRLSTAENEEAIAYYRASGKWPPRLPNVAYHNPMPNETPAIGEPTTLVSDVPTPYAELTAKAGRKMKQRRQR